MTDLQRELIDYDSTAALAGGALDAATSTGLSKYVEPAWPKGLEPRAADKLPDGDTLPQAAVLVVTWTMDEGHATSRVLTPGKDSKNDYRKYTHNFAEIAKNMSHRSPAVEADCLGQYWLTTIGPSKVVVFKSNSHLSQDTDKQLPSVGPLPNYLMWKQLIAEVRPKLVLTTGTAGGIGPNRTVGDVIVSSVVRFCSRDWLKNAPFAKRMYRSQSPHGFQLDVTELLKANADKLPNNKSPKFALYRQGGVVTTDFFGFDTSDDHYKLQGLGDCSEMGDAVLGMVCDDLGHHAPDFLAVRNVSDPQIKATGTLEQQANEAAKIYKDYGRWSTVCSAIVCWGLIA